MPLNAATATRLPPEPPPFPVRNILGVRVFVAHRQEAIGWLQGCFDAGTQVRLGYANTNLLNKLRVLPEGVGVLDGFTVLNDGIGLDVASRLLYGESFPENLNGTDFTPDLLRALGPRARVFLFGSRRDSALKAATVFRERDRVEIVGMQDGFTWSDAPDDLIRRINASGANVVLVALGNPAQELWIRNNARYLRARLIVAVGALFDFTSGAMPRAPGWVQRLRIEWFYRLVREPRRLGRRYTIELVAFLRAVVAQRRLQRTPVPRDRGA